MDARIVATNNSREHHAPFLNLTQLTRLKPQQMDERREKGSYFNCDKYSKGHKCGENKLFYMDHEEEEC